MTLVCQDHADGEQLTNNMWAQLKLMEERWGPRGPFPFTLQPNQGDGLKTSTCGVKSFFKLGSFPDTDHLSQPLSSPDLFFSTKQPIRVHTQCLKTLAIRGVNSRRYTAFHCSYSYWILRTYLTLRRVTFHGIRNPDVLKWCRIGVAAMIRIHTLQQV